MPRKGPGQNQYFRWAVLGTGEAARAFTQGLVAARGHQVAAVGSRSPDRAGRFCRLLAPEAEAVETYDALSRSVDAVYIATPPHTHHKLALAALAAGRPVLIEKPFATTARDADEIRAAAQRSGVFCMEAMWTRFLPLCRHVDGLLRSGAIGELTSISGSFGKGAPSAPHALDPTQGGGALLDRGVYPLTFVIQMAGEPRRVVATSVTAASGADVEFAAVLSHDNDVVVSVQASLRGGLSNDLRYVGTRGSLHVHAPVYRPVRALHQRYPMGSTSSATGEEGHGRRLRAVGNFWKQSARQAVVTVAPALSSGRPRVLWRPYRGNGYHYQAEEVARCLAMGATESRVMPVDDSVAVIRTADRIRGAWSVAPAKGTV